MRPLPLHRGCLVPRQGYTLMELLIVVVIIAILAAIIVPRYTSASENARRAALKEQLQTVRGAIELYRAQHGGDLPNIVADWTSLTSRGFYRGRAVGPYLPCPAVNPLNGSSKVLDGEVTAVPAGQLAGFVYDYRAGAGSGRIVATNVDCVTIFRE